MSVEVLVIAIGVIIVVGFVILGIKKIGMLSNKDDPNDWRQRR